MLKNLSVRLKIALIYVVIVIFTIPILIVSYLTMVNLNNTDIHAGDQIVSMFGIIYIVFVAVYVLAVLFLGRKLTGSIVFPLRNLQEIAKNIALGNVNTRPDYEARDEIGSLTEEFRLMIESINQQSEVLSILADGDYSVTIPIRSEQDIMNRAINQLINQNNGVLLEIRNAAMQVSSAATQIANASQSLAAGASEQASSIEQFSAAISEVKSQAEDNTRIASSTLENTKESGQLMTQSTEYMYQLTEAMQTISEKSKNIASVIKVIDDIAFQTNILALNAAVEAARAGQHGKGFAIVADEVRNLASKSAAAAKETAGLIEGSVNNVAQGRELTQKTNESLSETEKIAANNAENIRKLSDASNSQSISITEINQGIQQIATVVQVNSSLAEQSSAAAQELSAQSAALSQIVARFKLK